MGVREQGSRGYLGGIREVDDRDHWSIAQLEPGIVFFDEKGSTNGEDPRIERLDIGHLGDSGGDLIRSIEDDSEISTRTAPPMDLPSMKTQEGMPHSLAT